MPDHKTPDDDFVEALLRRSLAPGTPPNLSAEFETRLSRRLAPRRLDTKRRRFLAVYALFGIGLSLWLMRSSGMTWPLSALALIAPAPIVVMLRRHFRGRR